jgi:hypothetical protein
VARLSFTVQPLGINVCYPRRNAHSRLSPHDQIAVLAPRAE